MARARPLVAFVAACIVGGGLAGPVEINDSQEGNGDSAHAQALTEAAGLDPPEQESILVRTRDGSRLADADLEAVSSDAAARLRGLADVSDLQAPERSADGQAALITWSVPGDADGASGRIDATLAATAALQAAHPGLAIDEIGGASVEQAIDDTLGTDFEQAERLSLPRDAADPDPRLRRPHRGGRAGAARALLRGRGARPDRRREPPRADVRVDVQRDPAGRAWRSASTTRCSTCAGPARSAPRGANRARSSPPPRPPAAPSRSAA